MKLCNQCNTFMDLNDFGKDRHNKDGLTHYCKECKNTNLREYNKRKPEIRKKINAKNAENRRINYQKPEVKIKYRNDHLIKNYGITLDDYNAMLAKQNNVCAICNRPENSVRTKHLAVDHCHKTGKIRGLLCSNHNRALGLLNEDIEILQKTINYLKENI